MKNDDQHQPVTSKTLILTIIIAIGIILLVPILFLHDIDLDRAKLIDDIRNKRPKPMLCYGNKVMMSDVQLYAKDDRYYVLYIDDNEDKLFSIELCQSIKKERL